MPDLHENEEDNKITYYSQYPTNVARQIRSFPKLHPARVPHFDYRCYMLFPVYRDLITDKQPQEADITPVTMTTSR